MILRRFLYSCIFFVLYGVLYGVLSARYGRGECRQSADRVQTECTCQVYSCILLSVGTQYSSRHSVLVELKRHGVGYPSDPISLIQSDPHCWAGPRFKVLHLISEGVWTLHVLPEDVLRTPYSVYEYSVLSICIMR